MEFVSVVQQVKCRVQIETQHSLGSSKCCCCGALVLYDSLSVCCGRASVSFCEEEECEECASEQLVRYCERGEVRESLHWMPALSDE